MFVLECVSAEAAETTKYLCSTVRDIAVFGDWKEEFCIRSEIRPYDVCSTVLLFFSITSRRQNRRRVNGFSDALAAAAAVVLTPVRRANTTMCLEDTVATRRHIDLFIRPC